MSIRDLAATKEARLNASGQLGTHIMDLERKAKSLNSLKIRTAVQLLRQAQQEIYPVS